MQASRQYPPNENLSQQIINVERNTQVDLQQTPTNSNEIHGSSIQTASTVVAANESTSAPTFVPDTSNDPINTSVNTLASITNLGDINSAKQDLPCIQGSAQVSASKVTIKILQNKNTAGFHNLHYIKFKTNNLFNLSGECFR